MYFFAILQKVESKKLLLFEHLIWGNLFETRSFERWTNSVEQFLSNPNSNLSIFYAKLAVTPILLHIHKDRRN